MSDNTLVNIHDDCAAPQIQCPTCGAAAGEECSDSTGTSWATKMHSARMEVGPREVPAKTRMSCTGCPALVLKPWEDFLENDERDFGVEATCASMDGKCITAYWNDRNDPPGWCPGRVFFLPKRNVTEARIKVLEDALRGLDLEGDDCNCHGPYRCARCKALEALGDR